jgi:hypothetical protein
MRKMNNVWHTNHHSFEKVKLEIWSLIQCLPERTTYKFNNILHCIYTVYF